MISPFTIEYLGEFPEVYDPLGILIHTLHKELLASICKLR